MAEQEELDNILQIHGPQEYLDREIEAEHKQETILVEVAVVLLEQEQIVAAAAVLEVLQIVLTLHGLLQLVLV